MKFAVTVVSPPNNPHSAAFHEVAESLHYGLLALGHDSILTTQGSLPNRQHIVLGSNLLPRHPITIASNAILYNLEQVEIGGEWFTPELIDIFKRHVIWDYCTQNATLLSGEGIKVANILPIGYVKELTRIQHITEPDIDIAFFGRASARRQAAINQMLSLGLRVAAGTGIYGKERDAIISRSRLMINIHYYNAKVLEITRISYLMANRCAVLSEYSADPKLDAEFSGAIAFADYGNLAQRARELIDAPDERRELAQRGFDFIRTRQTMDYLRTALDNHFKNFNSTDTETMNN